MVVANPRLYQLLLLLLLVTGAVLLWQPRLFGKGGCHGEVPPICRTVTGPNPSIEYFPKLAQ